MIKAIFKKILVYFNLLPAYELVDTSELLDRWAGQPRQHSKKVFINDNRPTSNEVLKRMQLIHRQVDEYWGDGLHTPEYEGKKALG
jgi:hypothetical protein